MEELLFLMGVKMALFQNLLFPTPMLELRLFLSLETSYVLVGI